MKLLHLRISDQYIAVSEDIFLINTEYVSTIVAIESPLLFYLAFPSRRTQAARWIAPLSIDAGSVASKIRFQAIAFISSSPRVVPLAI